ncbi:MAG: ribonuclease HII [Bifidobacteriaceae bacterium]|jgi:ribonuclease HII|nr:ribonuclease HII [Bifidobacteriaceae bacterium]
MPGGPTLETELAFLSKGAATVGGMDEVGRGALAGPVCVGVVVVDTSTPPPPSGLADSKLLTAAQRERLVPQLAEWGAGRALGWAGANEVDQLGIVGALRLAGCRALAELSIRPAVIILDGKHNWLCPPADLFASETEPRWEVRMKVKADRQCASVAAASVLAKVARDQSMIELAGEHPGYGWAANKGYGAPEHLEALRRFGPTPEHRQSWSLPGADRLEVRS